MATEVVTLPVCGDNYSYCVINGKDAIVIDACDSRPVINLLEKRHLSLRMILSTHHHGDHTGGNAVLKQKTGCTILGGDPRIADIDRMIRDGDEIRSGPVPLTCIETPGHTRGSFIFALPLQNALFTGDTMFYAGCGRLFEGAAPELYHSLKTIASYPPDTCIYAGHEYTLDNLKFARSVEPDNPRLVERTTTAGLQLHSSDKYGPSSLEEELSTNPFLRTGSPTIRKTLGLLPDADDVMVFEELRKRKDCF